MTSPILRPELNPLGFDVSKLPVWMIEYLNADEMMINTLDENLNINCIECENCKACIRCMWCKGAIWCKRSSNCVSCISCNECHGCKWCDACEDQIMRTRYTNNKPAEE